MNDVDLKIIEAFKKAQADADAADKKLDEHFRPIVEQALKDKNVKKALSIAKKLMGIGSVSGVFLMDTIQDYMQNNGIRG